MLDAAANCKSTLKRPTLTFPNLKVDSRDLAMSTMRGLHNIITPSGGEGGRSRHESVHPSLSLPRNAHSHTQHITAPQEAAA